MFQTHATQQSAAAQAHHYTVRLATTRSEIREAQKLRYRVFTDEFGARPSTVDGGLDQDHYDAWCEHLIVRDEAHGRIVGTYRILPPAQAKKVGSYGVENEFFLTRLEHQRLQMVEIGRSCIDPDYRRDVIIDLLWAKLAEYLVSNGYGYLIGCASVGMADGGHGAADLFSQLADAHMAPAEYQVAPRCRLPFERLISGGPVVVPPRVESWLRAGAWICGEPAWNPDWNTAELPMLLPMSRLSERFRRHFIGRRTLERLWA